MIQCVRRSIWCFLPFLIWGCREAGVDRSTSYLEIRGETMGTYYQVRYADPSMREFKKAIDSLLLQINLEVSTYIPTSTISMFNQSDKDFLLSYNPNGGQVPYPNQHLKANLLRARDIYLETHGHFDPTVMPLVNYWGFGYTEKKKVEAVDSVRIDSLVQLVGFDQVIWKEDANLLSKDKVGVQLDLSACAKGYGVDAVAALLATRGITNYMVEIGGEVVVKGLNAKGKPWSIAVSLPKEGAGLQDIQAILALKDMAVATSGNYRNFYEVAGEKFAHIISPFTGFTEKSNLLSVSVLANDCITADAYATAFMVMGLEKALAFAKEKTTIEAYFIYSNPDGSMAVAYTDGIPPLLTEL